MERSSRVAMSNLEGAGLLVESCGTSLLVTLNRPARRNAFDADLMRSLAGLWAREDLIANHRSVILTGTDPAFCAGADVSLLGTERFDAQHLVSDELAFLPGPRIDVPVIVAVNGVCAGGGLHFVADADIGICSERASFLDPHVSVGQVSALEPAALAMNGARFDVVLRMALLGKHERLDATQACGFGLVSEVVAHDRLLPRAFELAEQIASNSPAAVTLTRKAFRKMQTRVLEESLQEGWDLVRSHWPHPDAREGPAAFVEGRAPQWNSE